MIRTSMHTRKRQPVSLLTPADPAESASRSYQGGAAPCREGHADAMVGTAAPDATEMSSGRLPQRGGGEGNKLGGK